jgi:hypothetical protein
MVKQSHSIRALCFALVASAGQASAQDAVTTLNLQVSTDGINWTNGLDLEASSATRRVLFRASASWSSDTEPAPLGLSGLTFQPIFAGFREADAIAPFVNTGNNLTGGGVTIDSTPMDGPFGRVIPFAAIGSSTRSYVVHVHNAAGLYLRIARNDITRWIGTGPTSGTAAVNNFNGAGGVVIAQKAINAPRSSADPAFLYGTQDIVLFQIALDIAPNAGSAMLDLSIDVPPMAMQRNAVTNLPEALWFTDASAIAARTRVDVISASIHVRGDFPPPPTCPRCIADANEDGGIDGNDVSEFFALWESGDACGDANQDGGIDGADVYSFFAVWEAGGC